MSDILVGRRRSEGVASAVRAIRVRLLLLVAAAVLPLVGVEIMDCLDWRSAALHQARTEVLHSAVIESERRSGLFEAARLMLSMLRSSPGVVLAGGPDCSAATRRARASGSQFMTVGVVSADGTIVCHSLLDKQQEFGDRDLTSRMRSAGPDELVIGKLGVGKVTGRPTVIAAMPLPPETGEGFAFASVDLPALDVALSDLDANGKQTLLVDRLEAKVLAGRDAESSLVFQDFASTRLSSAMQSAKGPDVFEGPGVNGRDEIVGFAPLRTPGAERLSVIVARPRADAVAEADARMTSRMALTLPIALSALLLTLAFGHFALVRPIAKLSDAAERIGLGDVIAAPVMEGWQSSEFLALDATLRRAGLRLERQNRELERLAFQDGLTGLANRRRFDAIIEAERLRSLRSSAPLSLLMIDVDHFKAFNDRYGHLAGDDCLRQVAEKLEACAGRAGDLVARYGGEEIAVLLPGSGLDGAWTVAGKAILAVSELSILHEGSPTGRLTVSIGCASSEGFRPVEFETDALVRLADQALYEAKRDGRNRRRAVSARGDVIT